MKIFEIMWHNYKIIDVLVVIPYFNVAETYMSDVPGVQESNTKAFELYTWYPFSARGNCGDVGSVDVIDKWMVENSAGFLKDTSLFPNKISGNSMGCTLKVATRVFPPVIVEMPQSSKEKYGGLELNILRCISEKLNLSVEYKVSVSKNESQFEMKTNLIEETAFGETDLSVGGLTISDKFISSADFTVPYVENVIKWYVPCAKHSHPWTAILRVFTLGAWVCVFCCPLPMIIFMRYIAIRVSKYQLRESHKYMTFESCFSIIFSIGVGVPVTELPRTSVLRTFVFVYICCSLLMNIVFQSYFTSFLLNPGFEKQISNIEDIIESGIQYGYSRDVEERLKYDANEYEYGIIQGRRIMCEDQCRCLERMLKDLNFACVSNTFCAELLIKSAVPSDTRREVCMLQNEVGRLRSAMYLKRGHPLLSHFNKIIRRLIEVGLVRKWMTDFISNQKLMSVLSSLSYGKDGFGSKNIVADAIYEEGYFVFSVVHLQASFHILLLGHSLSLIVLIAEIVYRRLLGRIRNTYL
jgi:hypothetical protein